MVCKTCLYNNFNKSKRLKLIFALLAVELGYFFAFENPSMESIFIGLGLATAGGSTTVSTTSIAGGSLIMAHTTTIDDYSQPSTAVASSEAPDDFDETDHVEVYVKTTGSAAAKSETYTGHTMQTGHALIGKHLSKVQFKLSKLAGATGTLKCEVYDETDTLVTQIGSDLDVASVLTTTNVFIDFVATRTQAEAALIADDWQIVIRRVGVVGTVNMLWGLSPLFADIDAGYVGALPLNLDTAKDWYGRLWHGKIITFVATKAVNDDTTKHWKSTSETNPNIYTDEGSTKNICALAIYLHADTDETEFKIRVGADATFDDTENVRTITMSKLTAGQWNYIRFDIATGRYIEIYGSSGASKILAISEIKVYTVTDAVMNGSHGHLAIDETDTLIGLDGT